MHLLHILLLAWLSWRGYKYYAFSPLRLYYFPALAFKISAGIGLGLIYLFYYGGGDTIKYHEDASVLAAIAWEDPGWYSKIILGNEPAISSQPLHYGLGQERALFAVKIFSLFHFFTDSNYWITATYLSFLSFLSLFFMAYRLVRFRPALLKPTVLAFLFWPSFVFWSSGLLKESLTIICISVIIAVLLPYILGGKKIKTGEAIVAAMLMVFLFQIKYYYAGILAPVILCLLLTTWVTGKFTMERVQYAGVFFGLLFFGFMVTTQLHPNMYLGRFLQVWIDNYYLIVQASAEGAFIKYENIEASWSSVLYHSPKAVFSGLMAPLFQVDFSNPLRMAASAENILLFLLAIVGLGSWIILGRKLSLPVIAVIVYITILALIIGIAAPNYGSLSRYRISYQPFFVFLVMVACQHLIERKYRSKEINADKQARSGSGS